MYNEKKTDRLLLRMGEEMAREIRQLADIGHRSIQNQIRYLLEIALKHESKLRDKVSPGPSRQLMSSGGNYRKEEEGAA